MFKINNLDIVNQALKISCIHKSCVAISNVSNWFLFPMESMPYSLHRIKYSQGMKQGFTGQGPSFFLHIRWQEVEWKKSGKQENWCDEEEWSDDLDTLMSLIKSVLSLPVLWNFFVIWTSVVFFPLCVH